MTTSDRILRWAAIIGMLGLLSLNVWHLADHSAPVAPAWVNLAYAGLLIMVGVASFALAPERAARIFGVRAPEHVRTGALLFFAVGVPLAFSSVLQIAGR